MQVSKWVPTLDLLRSAAHPFYALWRVADHVLGNRTPVHQYEQKTWGHTRPTGSSWEGS